ncbi:MAG: arabinogalactan endo-beta-1,4-galactanase [Faecousia sp.]
MQDFIKGMDISTLPEVEACGGRFFDHGQPGDAIQILKHYGMNLARLRLWNDPYSEDGTPYGAGTNDLPRTIQMARRLEGSGIDWMLDFHYSDFWADPGKQTIPKAWRGMSPSELEQAVYGYTLSVMETLRTEGLTPGIVAVGNEITKGLLWQYGKVPNFGNIALFLNAGIRAVREAAPNAKVMLHLDNGGNNALYRSWFDSYFASGGMDFDIIGLSYYPFWHGTLEDLKNNMYDLALRYHKDMIVAEVSTGYTLEDYASYEKLLPEQRKGMATKPALVKNVPYPMTPEGQCQFMRDFMERIREVPENRGKGFVYWEPAWLPVPGSGWANDAALAYTGEKGPGGNEWANQALFDYCGNALPALEVIRDFS